MYNQRRATLYDATAIAQELKIKDLDLLISIFDAPPSAKNQKQVTNEDIGWFDLIFLINTLHINEAYSYEFTASAQV